MQTRGDDGPVWSPDGTQLAFVVASVLWVVDGAPPTAPSPGKPRQITDEVTDAPSWSGDSARLLYLNNGRLRLSRSTGSRPRTVPMPLTWTQHQAARPHRHPRRPDVGRRRAAAAARDVDIVVRGPPDRRASSRTAPGATGTVVDARDRCVMPGLIDMHHHREMQGYSYGDRGRVGCGWRSASPRRGRPAARPTTWSRSASRSSPAPGSDRGYFATGEAVDGPRIFYNFMRPTFDQRPAAPGAGRAPALDYDLMKCYVRLPVAVAAAGHRLVAPRTASRSPRTTTTRRSRSAATAWSTSAPPTASATPARSPRSAPATTTSSTCSTQSRWRERPRCSATRRSPRRHIAGHRPAGHAAVPALGARSAARDVTAAKTTDQTVARANLASQVARSRRMVRGGGVVTTGTDSPIDPLAISTHMNLRAMVTFGLTP